MTRCSIKTCPGEYEKRFITHVVKHRGQIIVFDHVPAEVCSICGDVLFSIETAEALEVALKQPGTPTGSAPIYELAL
ncbi:MAG: YgiT-type zinc finger protein [Deltaproteobacteria bacterium]|nr:YgiT-type zinc finger protein [Deltaproteobacteria bacterium]